MKSVATIICGLWSCLALMAAPKYSFQNQDLTDDQRVDSLLSMLTIDEKVHYLSTDLGVERLGIPHCHHFEGLHGLTLGGPAHWGGKEKNDKGELVATDQPTTIFPQSYGLAASWDTDLLHRISQQAAIEARYYMHNGGERYHSLVMRAPNADLARDPRWGRTEESFGEDPYLTAQLTVACVKGLQGDNPRYWRTASLMKHFLANSNEDGRDSTSSNFDNRLFHEYYSFPFYKGITEGGSRAFMASYNSWNGTPMCINPCLDQITRKEWGQNGIICTDGGALNLLVNAHHAYPTFPEAAAAVVKATTGQFLDRFEEYVKEALKQGFLTEADIDKAIRGNIYVALKLGLLDDPDSTENPYSGISEPPYQQDSAKQLAREAMGRSIVLLKNDVIGEMTTPLLPLNRKKVKRIAVIGQYANHIVQDWYSGTPAYEVTILDGIRRAVGEDVEVLYAEDNRMGEAEEIAAKADVAIVCVGNHPYGTNAAWKVVPVPSDGREAVDRESLMLPTEDMVKLVYRANPNTVLVLVSSFPYTINWSNEHLPAIIQATHCCQEQGSGVADVLFGDVNPAGRTVQTWVKDITDLPPMMDYDIRNGRTYMYAKIEPLYPFGYGLSYSTFSYDKVQTVERRDSKLRIVVDVTNRSDRDGDEVVQLYASYPESKVARPSKQLRAFSRVNIKAGETKPVDLLVNIKDLGYWNDAQNDFVVEPGRVTLHIGPSSAKLPLTVDVNL